MTPDAEVIRLLPCRRSQLGYSSLNDRTEYDLDRARLVV
jgi:hypothetical protein